MQTDTHALVCAVKRGDWLQASEDEVALVAAALEAALGACNRPGSVDVRIENWSTEPDLVLSIERIKIGNQFLRWLMPGLSPAEVQLNCEFKTPNGFVKEFRVLGSGNSGLFGGTGHNMLRACAKKAVKRIRTEIPALNA
jgi:hypothetical protein